MDTVITSIRFRRDNLNYVRARGKAEDRSLSYMINAILDTERKRKETKTPRNGRVAKSGKGD